MTSVIFGADQQVGDFEAWLERLVAHPEAMASVGARHVVVYRCVQEPNRVFVTAAVHPQVSLEHFLSSGAMLEWFDAARDDDVPPIFVGHTVEKLELPRPDSAPGPSGVIVGSIGKIDSMHALIERIHRARTRFMELGVWRFWIYQAVDDPTEVMLMQELASEDYAADWLERRQRWAVWAAGPGVGVYPSPFVGLFVRHLAVQSGV